MNEKELIRTIKNILNSEYIGDDCAYLEDLGIVVTQDSLVEDVHFSLSATTPYKLGWKSAMVNISDVAASGAKPEYMTVALSLNRNLDKKFVEDFYKGLKDASGDVKIVGGDITGSDKLYISITLIGSAKNRKISSKKNAKAGYRVIVSGEHGNSATGLKILQNKINIENGEKFVNAHLMPCARCDFSREIAENIKTDYAMTDTSDGLADALLQIAEQSGVCLSISSNKILHDKIVDMNTVLYGGEDYELVAAVPENVLKYISNYSIIGEVKEGLPNVELDGKILENINENIFNHFNH